MGDNAKGSARRVRWTKTEDAILTQLVKNYGSSQWHKVSRAMGSRNATECYNRYCNSSLALKLNPITSQEENRIRRLRKDRQSWRKIARKFPGRTGALLKNWWWQNNKPNQRELRSHYHRNVQDVPAKEPGCDGSQFKETAARRDCPETATQREGNMEEQTANTDIGTRRNTEKQAGEPQTRESTSSRTNHLKTPTPTTRVEPQKSFSPQRVPVGYCRRRNRATALQNRGFGAKPQPLNAHNEVGAAADTKISAMAHPPANHAKIAIAKCAGKNDQVALPDGIGLDAESDAELDAELDAALDAELDAASEADLDAELEAESEIEPDAELHVEIDVESDAKFDEVVVNEVDTELSPDAELDTRLDSESGFEIDSVLETVLDGEVGKFDAEVAGELVAVVAGVVSEDVATFRLNSWDLGTRRNIAPVKENFDDHQTEDESAAAGSGVVYDTV
ncbi:hypothetical protein ARSEF1564_009970 [Beauveria bassiana]